MAATIQADYEKDFVLEAMLNDMRFQEKKALKRSIDMRRSTKTSEARNVTAKRKLKILEMKEKSIFSPQKFHEVGTVPTYYPAKAISKMLNTSQSVKPDTFKIKELMASLDGK